MNIIMNISVILTSNIHVQGKFYDLKWLENALKTNNNEQKCLVHVIFARISRNDTQLYT